MTLRRTIVVGGAACSLFASGVLGAAPALADVSPHCQQGGFCVFSGTNFTGTMVSVPGDDISCHPVSELGIPVVRSAARGFGDGSILELYPDQNCTGSAELVTGEIADTAALSYRLLFIPG